MSEILFLDAVDIRRTPKYIEELKAVGLLPEGVTGAEFLGNSLTPKSEETIKFYKEYMRMFKRGKVLVQIPDKGVNLDMTPNGATIYIAIDKET